MPDDSKSYLTSNVASLRSPDLTNSFNYMGVLHSFLVNDIETEGGVMVLRFLARPGSEPPAHVHEFEHEFFCVLEGEIEFFVEGEQHPFVANAGSVMHLPRGKAHALRFRTAAVSALAMLHAISGHRTAEAYLKSMATGRAVDMELPDDAPEYSTLDATEMQHAVKLAAEHGVTFLTPGEIAKRLPLFAHSIAQPPV